MLTLWNQPNGMSFRTRDVDEFFNDIGWPFSQENSRAASPKADIRETANEYIVEMDLPGHKKDGISVNVDAGILTDSSEREQTKTETTDVVHRTERFIGTYSRSFKLPTSVDATKTKATYADGILTVLLPKLEEVKPKSIRVN